MYSKARLIVYIAYTFIKHEQNSDKPTTDIMARQQTRPTYRPTYNKR